LKIAQGQRLGQCLPFFIYSLFRINALLFYQIRGQSQICNFKGGRRAECRRMAGSGRPGLHTEAAPGPGSALAHHDAASARVPCLIAAAGLSLPASEPRVGGCHRGHWQPKLLLFLGRGPGRYWARGPGSHAPWLEPPACLELESNYRVATESGASSRSAHWHAAPTAAACPIRRAI
jgi:hypothetical protein